MFTVFRIRYLRDKRIAPDAPICCSLILRQVVEREALEAVVNAINGTVADFEVEPSDITISPAFILAPEGPHVEDVAEKAIYVAVVGNVDGLERQDMRR